MRQFTSGGDARGKGVAFLGDQSARGGTVLSPAMQAAYRYGDPDRPLNVVILSDGMTKQDERAELLGLIKAKPSNARVFCIGVGNEVNRPLLKQLAEDAGGLAAFLSRGDDFKQAAKAFRRRKPSASLAPNIGTSQATCLRANALRSRSVMPGAARR